MESNPEYSLEGLMLKLKIQYFGPPDVKSQLIGKDPDAGKDWGQKETGMTEDGMAGWHHWLKGHSLRKLREIVKDREAWRAAAHGLTKCQKGLSNWTTSICNIKYMAHSKSNIVLTKTHSCGESPYSPASGCSIMHNWGKWPCKGCCRGLWAHERDLAFQSQHHWKSAV